MAWGALLAVLEVFRRRLTLEQAVDFAKALPPIMRAVFIADLHAVQPVPFAERAELVKEVRMVHRDHQFAPPTVIEDIAVALRRHVDASALDRALAKLPAEALAFWSIRPSVSGSRHHDGNLAQTIRKACSRVQLRQIAEEKPR